MSSSAQTDAFAELIGREADSEHLDRLTDRFSSAGGALVIRGEPAFAGLHQLLHPIIGLNGDSPIVVSWRWPIF